MTRKVLKTNTNNQHQKLQMGTSISVPSSKSTFRSFPDPADDDSHFRAWPPVVVGSKSREPVQTSAGTCVAPAAVQEVQ